jgi:hypothetical protein
VLGLKICREAQAVSLQLKIELKSAKIDLTIRHENQKSESYGKSLKFGNI